MFYKNQVLIRITRAKQCFREGSLAGGLLGNLQDLGYTDPGKAGAARQRWPALEIVS